MTIIKSDLKIIFRDASLRAILFVPIIFTALLLFAPPWYEELLPVLINYRPLILAFFCIMTSVLMGFILSFILLDERDQNLVPVFNILPFSFKKLLVIRVGLIMSFALTSSMVLIHVSGLVSINIIQSFLLSLACSSVGASTTFIITTFAKNKIEGVTFFKLFNMILFLPIAGMFFESSLSWLFGILPYYWIYLSFSNLAASHAYSYIFVALFLNFILLILTFRIFATRI